MSRLHSKGESKGEIRLKIQLEAIEDNVVRKKHIFFILIFPQRVMNSELNHDLFTITKALGFQIPVQVNLQLASFPGEQKVYIHLND